MPETTTLHFTLPIQRALDALNALEVSDRPLSVNERRSIERDITTVVRSVNPLMTRAALRASLARSLSRTTGSLGYLEYAGGLFEEATAFGDRHVAEAVSPLLARIEPAMGPLVRDLGYPSQPDPRFLDDPIAWIAQGEPESLEGEGWYGPLALRVGFGMNAPGENFARAVFMGSVASSDSWQRRGGSGALALSSAWQCRAGCGLGLAVRLGVDAAGMASSAGGGPVLAALFAVAAAGDIPLAALESRACATRCSDGALAGFGDGFTDVAGGSLFLGLAASVYRGAALWGVPNAWDLISESMPPFTEQRSSTGRWSGSESHAPHGGAPSERRREVRDVRVGWSADVQVKEERRLVEERASRDASERDARWAAEAGQRKELEAEAQLSVQAARRRAEEAAARGDAQVQAFRQEADAVAQRAAEASKRREAEAAERQENERKEAERKQREADEKRQENVRSFRKEHEKATSERRKREENRMKEEETIIIVPIGNPDPMRAVNPEYVTPRRGPTPEEVARFLAGRIDSLVYRIPMNAETPNPERHAAVIAEYLGARDPVRPEHMVHGGSGSSRDRPIGWTDPKPPRDI